MIEKDLDKVLNYMKQYVENKYEHDSEPMLTWKDLKLVLNEIERLNNIIDEIYTFLSQYTITHTWQKLVIEDTFKYIDELKGSDK